MEDNKVDDWEDVEFDNGADDWEDVEVSPNPEMVAKSEDSPSMGESVVRGTRQGATFGFSDEIDGAIQSGLDKVFGLFGKSPSSVDQDLKDQGFSGDLSSSEEIIKNIEI